MAFLPDLDTRTVLNVVEENFERIGLKAYAIRMIYTGEHALNKEETIKLFQETGSEDTVHRHLRFLFEAERKRIEEKFKDEEKSCEASEGVAKLLDEEHTEQPEKKIFKRAKLLMVYHSIQTFLLEDWRAFTARPPSLIGKLDVHGPLSEHMEQLRICLDKIKRICAYAKADENLSFEGLSAVDPKMEALPEVALIDYLLQSQYILDLRHVAHLHRRVDDYAFYYEHVWPLKTHFTPRQLYKLKIDDCFVEPLPVMPWELVKKEVEDEEKEDRQSGSDSTD
ncbi:uncharacterized protein LOC123868243 isoform X2 [Maniola jurtina]|uniref:uncharacterized protein LOC123868243 isoform X2 n=1 Tax=Maniola jurtina TaxID=191418 RepID=UPI001E68B5A3|nr:uncharacterized protein LOC123868243 isoform X2 [Maniola jurtina]